MCGGRGTRLGGSKENGAEADLDGDRPEKPLVEVREVAMVDRVVDALLGSRAERIYPVVSPHTPETRAHLEILSDGAAEDKGLAVDADRATDAVEILDAPGEGYVADLRYALDRVDSPVLTVACDLPLLSPGPIDSLLDRTEGTRESLAAVVPAALKRQLGASVDTSWTRGDRELAPTGLNVVASERGGSDTGGGTSEGATDDGLWVSYDARLAVNVNRPSDLAVAEALCE